MSAATKSKRTQARALAWYGAGTQVAEYHAGLLKDCKHVTSLFGGGLSVEKFLVETAGEVVVNDLHRLAINFYRIISDHETRTVLVSDLEETPFHESVLRESQEICKQIGANGWIEMTPREVAYHYFVTCWMGRSGKAGTTSEFNGGLAMRWDAGGGSSPLRFQTAVRSIQEVWGPICERCSFVCRDWREILPDVKDGEGIGTFVDPPWLVVGEKYTHKLSMQDHLDLEEALRRFRKTKVVVRYGNHPDILDLYHDAKGWRIKEIESRDQANGGVAELCITNF